ncbi:thromboxane-A synthase isoform X1 [Gadus morhua]|uniref:thromboxane-A synthase isoform X1 n=2 Tax=Gadus morhua TaxID=8049 RepID=UPI0011B6D54F|nr:thromboxane-A synthase isoform X1 [Gadus morhua]
MDWLVGLPDAFHMATSGLNITIVLFLLFLGLLYRYSVSPYSTLSRCGIKHPRPLPFFGNLFMFRQGFLDPINQIIRTHGRVCGYYIGRRPIVVLADPDIIRQVTVKGFSTFPNRLNNNFAPKPMSDCLLMLRDEQWKRVRSVLTPSFSSAKMREMVPLINTATDVLMNNLDAHAESGAAFDFHRCSGCFTMDVIASVAFGTQLDSQSNPDDPFVHNGQKFFGFTFFKPIILVSMMFPFLLTLLRRVLPKRRDTVSAFFTQSIQRIIKQRDDLPPEQRRRDFLQLMLDARGGGGEEVVSLEDFDAVSHAAGPSDPQPDSAPAPPAPGLKKKRWLTEDEVVGQAFIFLLAGYETSSNTISFACYLLATHPECQRRAQQEVDLFFSRHESLEYTNVQELKYLDMVFCEALRLYPPGFRYGRTVDEDCEISGQPLPKGATVEFSIGFLHYDPEYWPEPHRFIPERFTAEARANRHPFVYLPFGAGPRSCVGVRLAQLEVKMALVNVLRRFHLVACAETKVPLELKSDVTLGPKNGIFLKITKREADNRS